MWEIVPGRERRPRSPKKTRSPGSSSSSGDPLARALPGHRVGGPAREGGRDGVRRRRAVQRPPREARAVEAAVRLPPDRRRRPGPVAAPDVGLAHLGERGPHHGPAGRAHRGQDDVAEARHAPAVLVGERARPLDHARQVAQPHRLGAPTARARRGGGCAPARARAPAPRSRSSAAAAAAGRRRCPAPAGRAAPAWRPRASTMRRLTTQAGAGAAGARARRRDAGEDADRAVEVGAGRVAAEVGAGQLRPQPGQRQAVGGRAGPAGRVGRGGGGARRRERRRR